MTKNDEDKTCFKFQHGENCFAKFGPKVLPPKLNHFRFFSHQKLRQNYFVNHSRELSQSDGWHIAQ